MLRRLGRVDQAERAVGAGQRKQTVGEFDVFLGRLQLMRSDDAAFIDDFISGHHNRRAAHA